jgi:anaerobic selenocysteine-containing dehydrogenase
MVEEAERGGLDLLWAMGGNFMDVLPHPDRVAAALSRVPLRVHQDLVVASQMLLPPAETVLLLPAATRYEVPGGVTETTTERRIVFSPEIPGPRPGEARPEWEVFLELARRARPELADRLAFADTAAMRSEIARAVPFYDGIQHLSRAGDMVQYGGERLCEGPSFPTPDGKAHFAVVLPEHEPLPPGHFRLSTRRGKQFNSMVHEATDALTGARRQAVLMSAADAAALGLANGDPVALFNEVGRFEGQVALAPVKPGNLAVHWPEGNVLIAADRRSAESHVPHFNAFVRVERRPVDG